MEHYESLMKEAELREQRAEWRTRRLQLSDARRQLWHAEREEIRQEMEKLSFKSDQLPPSPQPHPPDLPLDDVIRDHVTSSDLSLSPDHLTGESAPSDAEESSTQERNVTFEEPLPLMQEPQLTESNIVQDVVITVPNKNVTKTADISKVHAIPHDAEHGSISKPHVSDSIIQQVLNPTNDNAIMEEFSKHLSPRQQPRRGVASLTTIKDILYPSNSPVPAYRSTRGKPPPTTIQNLLYHTYDQSSMAQILRVGI